MDVDSWSFFVASGICSGIFGWYMGLGYAHVQEIITRKKDDRDSSRHR